MLNVKLPTGETITLAHRYGWIDYIVPKDSIFTIRNTVYVSPTAELQSVHIPVLMHELVHVQQQQTEGSIKFLLQYFLSKRFRLTQEAAAYAFQIKYTVGLTARQALLDAAAKWLSGKEYWYCAGSYDEALIAIKAKCSYMDLF